ncbi:DUF2878 domain-containing protein [Photobacterium leiognathi]|uniref:DUF2878 domain-containing protein n=1 Tax=Photobacterium leiognathi TaxID=553611 RepID=UPI002980CE58|nr:DUF2878 domain-containing protein [Photobacterium leiognathi]
MERVNPLANKLKVILAGMVFNLYWLLAVWGQYRFVYILFFILLVTWFLEAKAWRFSLLAALPGIVIDSLLKQWNIFEFAVPNRAPLFIDFTTIGLIPTWLMMLWLGFTTFVWSIRDTITSISTKWLLVAGSIGGALSYWSGMKLEAVSFTLPVFDTSLILMLIWLALTRYMLWLLSIFNKRAN